MTSITVKGKHTETVGTLPKVGSTAPAFTLTKKDLSDAQLSSYGKKKKLLNIFPSLDTGVCAMSVKKFHEQMEKISDAVVLNISMDLPFAQNRFCNENNCSNAETLSAFRSRFPEEYGVAIKEGPMRHLCSRAVVVLDEDNKVVYTEQVPEIAQEPDYQRAIEAISAGAHRK